MNFLTHNFQLKIFAFLAALALWFFVVGIENSVYRFPSDLDIVPTNIPSNLTLTSELSTAKVVVKTGNDEYRRLTSADFKVFVDLKNYNAGDYIVPLLADVNNEKVTLLRIEPPTVAVKLEPVTSREVKVKTLLSGNPAKNFFVKEVKLSTDTVAVSGPESVLQQIETVNAEIILNGTQNQDFKTAVALKLDAGHAGKNILIQPEQITAEVTLEAEPELKSFPIQPVISGESSTSANEQLMVEPASVKIKGPQNLLSTVTTIETEAIAPVRLKNQPFKVKLIIPAGLTLAEGEPSTVTITVKESTLSQ